MKKVLIAVGLIVGLAVTGGTSWATGDHKSQDCKHGSKHFEKKGDHGNENHERKDCAPTTTAAPTTSTQAPTTTTGAPVTTVAPTTTTLKPSAPPKSTTTSIPQAPPATPQRHVAHTTG